MPKSVPAHVRGIAESSNVRAALKWMEIVIFIDGPFSILHRPRRGAVSIKARMFT